MPTPRHSSLTLAVVSALGKNLIRVADKFPTRFLTERDFFPLVLAYLSGRVPNLSTEVTVEDGDIDFRTGGPNPALLELAVAPRELSDSRRPDLTFPGHGSATQLYATQNISELTKLFSVPPARARNRYLLLLDFRDGHDLRSLKASYQREARSLTRNGAVRVFYVSYNRCEHFLLGR